MFELTIDPEVVEVVASGHHHGFIISEHDGWRRMPWVKDTLRKVDGKEHNPHIYMRAQNGKAPKLIVEAEKVDSKAPGKVKVKEAWRDNLQVGEVLIEVTATGDDGNEGKALYYDVTVDGKSVPAWMLYAPLAAGETQILRLSELEPGKKVAIGVCAVDEAGNRGPVAKVNTKVCETLTIPDAQPRYAAGVGRPT